MKTNDKWILLSFSAQKIRIAHFLYEVVIIGKLITRYSQLGIIFPGSILCVANGKCRWDAPQIVIFRSSIWYSIWFFI